MNPINNYNPGGMYGYQPQYQPQYTPRQRMMKCYPVTSIEEARAAMIDVDGTVTVFTDIANGRIYTKQVDLNGMAVMQVYEQIAPQKQINDGQRLDQLEAMVNQLREELENVKSTNLTDDKSNSKKSKSTAGDDSNVRE